MSKEDKLFDNLLKITHQYMSGRGFVPMTPHELMEKLCLPEQHKEIFLRVLKTLTESGQATVSKNRYHAKESRANVITGIIRMHPRGFGFVQADLRTQFPEDIFIPKPMTQNAVDGDKVEILINTDSISEKGPEGRVITILERGRTHVAGIVRTIEPHGDTIAYVPILGTAQRVVVENTIDDPLRVGDRIVMEVIDWGSKETETHCRVSHIIGHISDPSCDIPGAIEEYGLRADFPTDVLEEAKEFGTAVKQSEIKQREDLRELISVTIDPDTAKDFDDAISITKDEKGLYHLGVHIADVSHYVRPNTALDREAKIRANSTYFPRYCLPMLPSELSNNLCSLKPNVNRLAVSVLMVINDQGDLLNYRITRSVIKSRKRFTYKEALKVMTSDKPDPFKEMLGLMEELCHLLKAKRYQRGSLDLSLPELVVMVDEKGVPISTEFIEYDITHQMIEEFMLKGNEMIATHLSNHGKNLAYRIHEEPADENLKDFVELSRAFGFEIPDKPTQEDLQKLFNEATKTPYGQHLSTSYIRRMKMAIYSPENIGHYGLSLTHYCHFTSPIRRYADLVVHRILFGESDALEPLALIASHCSEQERISAKAESSVVLLKKLRLVQAVDEAEPNRQYEAVITSVKPYGITVEVLAFMLEAFIHISDIGDDYYEFVERKMRLEGKRTGKTYTAGDQVLMELKNVDLIILDSKWNLIPAEGSVEDVEKSKEKNRKERRSRRENSKKDKSEKEAPKKGRRKRR